MNGYTNPIPSTPYGTPGFWQLSALNYTNVPGQYAVYITISGYVSEGDLANGVQQITQYNFQYDAPTLANFVAMNQSMVDTALLASSDAWANAVVVT